MDEIERSYTKDEDDDDCPLLDSTETRSSVLIKKPRRSIVIEPLVFLYFYGQWGMTPLMSQYVFTQIGLTYNYTQPGIGNTNHSHCNLNKTDPLYILQQKIESETTLFNLLLSTSTTVPTLLLTLYMGGYTDRRGRRLGIVLPVIGVCIQSLVNLAVIFFNLDICVMFAGSSVFGFTGSNAVFLMAVFSYIADCTTEENRSRRITAIEILWAAGSCISSFSLGFWISGMGFLAPLGFICTLLIVAVIYALACVPETIVSSKNTSISVVEIFKEGVAVFRKDGMSRRPLRLFMLLCAFVLTNAVETTYSGTQTLYLMDSPLCFTSAEIGITNGVITSSLGVGAALGLLLLQKLMKLNDSISTVIGCVSAAGRFAFLGVANTRLLVFLTIPVGIFEYITCPLIRSSLSKNVSDDEQGSMFAVVAFLEGIIGLVGHVIWSMVYANTLLFYPGFVFFLMAAVNLAAIIFVGSYECVVRKIRKIYRNAQMKPIEDYAITKSDSERWHDIDKDMSE